MQKTNKPNFFIIGAPKCASTTVANYLASHPNIFMCEPKEPHYFASDFLRNRYVTNIDDYLSLFKGSEANVTAIGEASIWYMYSDVALASIKKFNPEAKIIIILRNPIEMIYSLHSENLYNENEDEEDFEQAWALQEDRAHGKHLPPFCRNPIMLQYAELGKHSKWLKRVYSEFTERNVMVALFDDLVNKPHHFYQEILRFLNVKFDGNLSLPKENKNKIIKSKTLNHFLQNPPAALRKAIVLLRSTTGIDLRKLVLVIRRLNSEIKPRAPMSEAMKNNLRIEFSEDIDLLSKALNRDLSHWKEQQ